VPPAKVFGFLSATPTEKVGDRFAEETDKTDVYVLSIREGESVSLEISDWDPIDRELIDFDLYLYNVNDTATVVDSSLNSDQTEWVTAPENGNYFVIVDAYAGTSNYLLRSGQTAPVAAVKLSAAVEMVEGEVIAALKTRSYLASDDVKNKDNSRIKMLEKEHALTIIRESGNGEMLYSVDTTRIDRLTPHPFALFGWGGITPEEWQVIRTAKALSASDDYRWSAPNYIQHRMEVPNDLYYEYQWHYPLINLPQAWDITTGSRDVVVSVIDSGVYDHPDLTSNVDYDLGYDFVRNLLNSGDWDGIDSDARDPGEMFPMFSDYKSHGTHVAGTIGAMSDNGTGVAGVNWDVTIMPVRVCGVITCDCWDITQGMRWSGRLVNDSGTLPSRKADVINMSLAGSVACPGSQDVIDQLVASGIIIIAAAGNDGNSVPLYPASSNNVISVSATTFIDELAPYSSYGLSIDVAAPGGDSTADLNGDGYVDSVLSPTMIIEQYHSTKADQYAFMQGTSMASPHVAGVAALMKSVYPEMGSSEFSSAISSGEIIMDLAQNGLTSKDTSFGFGRIDARLAVNWATEQEQGQSISAFLTSSISAANFGSNLSSIDFKIEKSGNGALSSSGGEYFGAWMEVFAVSTDGEGMGTYRINVDRSGLIDGSYYGWVRVDASNGSNILISVAMRVGDKVAGEAGYQYALLLDNWTFGNVKQWNGAAVESNYSIYLNSNPPGKYYLLVGSDIDNDMSVCDAGEVCQFYPLTSQASEIEVSSQNVQLGSFTMGFPGNSNAGDLSSATFGSSGEGRSNYSEIRAIIGESGVSRRK